MANRGTDTFTVRNMSALLSLVVAVEGADRDAGVIARRIPTVLLSTRFLLSFLCWRKR